MNEQNVNVWHMVSTMTDADTNVQSTTQNGEPRAIGSALIINESSVMIAEAARFPSVPNDDVKKEQERCKDDIFPVCKISSFDPRNEEQLEDWVDEAARLVFRTRMHPVLFQELWESRTSRAVASMIAKAPKDNYEGIVDFVANI
eukprot:GHVQ01038860.1.p1 GENE.GHVQ01038860.1~~GHVQ01038860.1.p1  ORF type:complete len:145 (+),score=14.48 GHVQ01038860.1:911-1345(+)